MTTPRPSEGIGERVSKYRRLAGITARELAEQSGLGLTRGIITNLENGRKTDLTVDQLIAISTVLGVPPVAIALPVDKPYSFVKLNGVREDEGVTRRAYQAVDRFTAAETGAENPAAYVASELVRGVKSLRPAAVALSNAKRANAAPEVIAELEEAIENLNRSLARLGVDLTKPQYGD